MLETVTQIITTHKISNGFSSTGHLINRNKVFNSLSLSFFVQQNKRRECLIAINIFELNKICALSMFESMELSIKLLIITTNFYLNNINDLDFRCF